VLTIWTILRDLEHPFIDGHHLSQKSWLETFHTYNAITSWGLLENVRIIMFGDEPSCTFAQKVSTNPLCYLFFVVVVILSNPIRKALHNLFFFCSHAADAFKVDLPAYPMHSQGVRGTDV